MSTYTPRDAQHLADLTAQFLYERVEARQGIDDVFSTWFADLSHIWIDSLDARCMPDFSDDQLDRFILAVEWHRCFRDALVLSALDIMSRDDMDSLVLQPFSEHSGTVISSRVWEYLNNPYCVPDFERAECALDILRSIAATLSETSGGFASMEAYLLWWLGHTEESKEMNETAVLLEDGHGLSHVLRNMHTMGLLPAWQRHIILQAGRGVQAETGRSGKDEKVQTEEKERGANEKGTVKD